MSGEYRIGAWLFTTVTAALAALVAIALTGHVVVTAAFVIAATAAATAVSRSELPSPARMSDRRAAGTAALLALVVGAGALSGQLASGLLVGLTLYLTVWVLGESPAAR